MPLDHHNSQASRQYTLSSMQILSAKKSHHMQDMNALLVTNEKKRVTESFHYEIDTCNVAATSVSKESFLCGSCTVNSLFIFFLQRWLSQQNSFQVGKPPST